MCYYLFGGGIGFRVFYRGLPIGTEEGFLNESGGTGQTALGLALGRGEWERSPPRLPRQAALPVLGC